MSDTDSPPAQSPAAPKPKRARPAGKGAPPPQSNTLGALTAAAPKPAKLKPGKTKPAKHEAKVAKPAKKASKERTEPLNFRVTNEFRRAFKRAAAAQDCKKVELLERIFTEWSARHPA